MPHCQNQETYLEQLAYNIMFSIITLLLLMRIEFKYIEIKYVFFMFYLIFVYKYVCNNV